MDRLCAPHLLSSLGSLADLDEADSFHLEEEAPKLESAGIEEPPQCAPQLPPTGSEVETLRRRNAQLQAALAEVHLLSSKQVLLLQQQLQDLQGELAKARLDRDSAASQVAPALRAQAEQEAATLRSQLLGTSGRVEQLLGLNAGLAEQHRLALERLAGAERELGALRAGKTSGAAEQQQEGGAAQALEQSQAERAALLLLLEEARAEQVFTAGALSTELRRSHALKQRIAELERGEVPLE